MFSKIAQIYKIKELRNKILFVLGIFVVFRLAANIPMPGIDPEGMRAFFEDFGVFRFASAFTGGALDRFSIVMLGLGPYITAVIVMQLLTMVFPQLERLQKEEGEAGRQKINQYGRLLTIPFALVQGYGMLALFQNQGVIESLGPMATVNALITIAAGTVFLMWLGELITEKGIGNGVSLLIFAGIIADFPINTFNMIAEIRDHPGAIQAYILLFLMVFSIIFGVILFTEARRNIPVSYAKKVRGTKLYGGSSTYLPLNLNPAGVIPIIFAFSLVSLPSIAAQFLSRIGGIIGRIANFMAGTLDNLWVFGLLTFILVFAFTYFYTAITFDPKNVADNLKKMGGFIPGIRPGEPTSKFLAHILNRTLFLGGLFLGTVAVLPWIIRGLIQVLTQTAIQDFQFLIGGASVLIIVSVVLETVKQINSQLQMREYETF